MIKKTTPSLLLCFLFLILSVWITENVGHYKRDRVLVYDPAGYYLYLPAILIHKDLYGLEFYKEINKNYPVSIGQELYGVSIHDETGNLINKYPLGLSFFQLPFFTIAHWYVIFNEDRHKADGFSKHYQRAVSYSNIFISFLGLLVLRTFLKKSFEEKFVWPTILIVAFGTNFYHYSVFIHGMSHAYSFFLYASVLLLSYLWHKQPGILWSLLLGLAIGLATIIRPTDILVALIPIGWKIMDWRYTLGVFKKYPGYLLLAAVAFLIAISPQLLYWYKGTGSFLYYSYTDEGFDFTNPQILNGLFSFRKGWFVYTPLALLGFIGIYFGLKNQKFRSILLVILMFYSLMIYIVFSWWMWFYGGSFGCRVLIQTYPLLAVPIALLISEVYSKRGRILQYILSTVIILGVALNIFQSYQYHKGIIHWDSMTWEWYWKVFLSLEYWHGHGL